VQQGCCLPAGLEAGSATRAAVRAAAKDVTGGDKLDPKRTVAFVVRGGTGLAKCIQAALLRTRRCSGESRQLEDHPRAAIQFLHAKGQGRPFGGHLDLGTRSYVGFSGDGKILAIAAENDWRLRRCTGASGGGRSDEVYDSGQGVRHVGQGEGPVALQDPPDRERQQPTRRLEVIILASEPQRPDLFSTRCASLCWDVRSWHELGEVGGNVPEEVNGTH